MPSMLDDTVSAQGNHAVSAEVPDPLFAMLSTVLLQDIEVFVLICPLLDPFNLGFILCWIEAVYLGRPVFVVHVFRAGEAVRVEREKVLAGVVQ